MKREASRPGAIQGKPNPLHTDSFEKRLIEQERRERKMAKVKYVLGIQGTDGGC